MIRGAFVVDQMGLQAPAGLLGIHTNMPATVPADVDKALLTGQPAPSGLSAEERRAYQQLERTFKQVDYARLMASRPQTLYGIADSPVGLAAWLLDHNDADGQPAAAVYSALSRTTSHRRTDAGRDPRQHHALLADEHGSLRLSSLLGIQGWLFQRQGRLHPGSRERLSRRAIRSPPELDRAGVSRAHLLQEARQGRPLRRVGAARAPCRRTPSRLQITQVRELIADCSFED